MNSQIILEEIYQFLSRSNGFEFGLKYIAQGIHFVCVRAEVQTIGPYQRRLYDGLVELGKPYSLYRAVLVSDTLPECTIDVTYDDKGRVWKFNFEETKDI